MSYKLEDREGMASGVRRIVAEEIDSALENLTSEPLSDEAVHEARKSLKKSRSALRLLRTDIGNDVRKRENATMRDAAQRLSGARDAQVMLDTLGKLAADPRSVLPAAAVRKLRKLLEQRRDELTRGADVDAEAARAAEELAEVRARMDEWPLEEEDFDEAAAGLRRIHRRGRAAMQTALKKGDDDSWHEWRKRVKDLWYALRILRPVAPEQLTGAVEEASELSDVLGDHNDLAVLAETVREHQDDLDPGHAELVEAALTTRRDGLRLAAVPLGMRLFAERPKAFARRLEGQWDAREPQAAADATWMPPEVVAQIRGILVAKGTAAPAEKRKLSAALPGLGFRVRDFADHVPSHRGGFSVADFDLLVEKGVIRIGTPPAPRGLAKGKARKAKASDNGTKAAAPEPEPDPEPDEPPARALEPRFRPPPQPSPDQLVRNGLRLAFGAARWARRRLR
jgi:CHAD domain-containing protein